VHEKGSIENVRKFQGIQALGISDNFVTRGLGGGTFQNENLRHLKINCSGSDGLKKSF
jgi:hypothetical protein